MYPQNNYGTGSQIVTCKTETVALKAQQALTAHLSLAPDAISANGIAVHRLYTTGSAAATIAASVDVPRCVSITFTAGAVAAGAGTTTVAVTGTDMLGAALTETLTAINGLTEGAKAFSAVVSAVVATAELYTLDLDSASAGTYLLGNDDDGWTTPLAFDASDGDILAALEVVYGAAPVVSVTTTTTKEIEFAKGTVAALEVDGAGLGNGTPTCTNITAAGGTIGWTDHIGLPILADHPTGFLCLLDATAIDFGTWVQGYSATVVASNKLDPGTTAGGNFNGTKVLDFYFNVPA
jgi:hypothetical protein